MVSAEDRMSTQVVQGNWLSPDDRNRPSYITDYEAGPIALNDPSSGLKYQPWVLTWDFATGDFTATPEDTGAPSVVHNASAVSQCSVAFDQNGHINISYTASGRGYIWWYDSLAAGHVTTQLPIEVITPTITLDDKRSTQTQASDIILWWTEDQGDGTYKLYRALQRDRFDPLVPKEQAASVPPYLYKCGMNNGFRLQLGASNTLL